MRRGPGSLYRRWKSLEYLATRDRRAVLGWLGRGELGLGPRVRLLRDFVRTTNAVRGYHTLGEMLAISREILARRAPVVLEAGCGYGSSTAKLSLAVRQAGGVLHACDSFRGMPENDEQHRHLDGRATQFRAGAFRGSLNRVRRTVAEYGALEVCRFHKGLVADTLPRIEGALDVVVLDVDLEASTRTCVRELFPRLRPGGVMFSLDGQLRATHELLGDPRFWRDDVGIDPPHIEGLGRDKLLIMRA
ncbi:MAG TPA: TylF/MycF/NovP-related O-methyltransferase [Kofleriaceae bacterium]|nr:TylF/MycF/NovP-related O-methyltransferase [Kofleriaceae bacterium]